MSESRIERVLQNLESQGLEQMLVCDPMSIWYLTGYYTEPYERFFGLLVARDAERRPRTVMFCNRLFPDATGAAQKLVTFDDTEDPVPLVAAELDGAAPLGVDKKLVANWLLPLMDARAASGFRLGSWAVDAARSVKDAREQELMRQASLTNDRAMNWLAAQVREGVTERADRKSVV